MATTDKDSRLLDEIEDIIVNQYGEEDEPFTAQELKSILDSIVEVTDQRKTES